MVSVSGEVKEQSGCWDSPLAMVPGGRVEGFQTLEAGGGTHEEEGGFQRLGDHEGTFTGDTQGRSPHLVGCVPLSSESAPEAERPPRPGWGKEESGQGRE